MASPGLAAAAAAIGVGVALSVIDQKLEITEHLADGINAGLDATGRALDEVGGVADDAIDGVGDVADDAVDKAGDLAGGAADKVGDVLGQLASAVRAASRESESFPCPHRLSAR